MCGSRIDHWSEQLLIDVIKYINLFCIIGDALTTDDFLGRIKNSTNLSIKAIVAIGGMAQLSTITGNTADATHYRTTAENYVKEWIKLGEDPSNKHIKLSYNTANTWFMIYNLYPDVLLDTKLVPENVRYYTFELIIYLSIV